VSAQSCAAEMHAGERLRLPLVLDRAQWLERLCAEVGGARGAAGPAEVAHFGCADSPYTEELLAAGALLRTRLVRVARTIVNPLPRASHPAFQGPVGDGLIALASARSNAASIAS